MTVHILKNKHLMDRKARYTNGKKWVTFYSDL